MPAPPWTGWPMSWSSPCARGGRRSYARNGHNADAGGTQFGQGAALELLCAIGRLR